MAAQLDGPIGQLEVLDRPPEIVQRRDRTSAAPASLAITSDAPASSTTWRGPAMSKAASRRFSATLGGAPLPGSTAHHPDPIAHRVGLAHLPEHAPLELDRREQILVRDQHLGLAEQQHAVVVEREVEPPQDLRLRLGGEIHQRVAADEQVDAGDRRILDEVVAAEDHASPEVLAEHVPLIGPLEELLERVAWHVLYLPRQVGAVTGVVERLLVDVGGVDLDPLPEGVISEHRARTPSRRVRLFAGCATRGPDTRTANRRAARPRAAERSPRRCTPTSAGRGRSR